MELCQTWAGGAAPLVAVDRGASIDSRWSPLLFESSIGLEAADGVLAEGEPARYSDVGPRGTQELLRIVAEFEERPRVQTCRGIPSTHPWHLSYLSAFGDLPVRADPGANRRNDLREDLTFADVATIEAADANSAGCRDLLDRLRNYGARSAVELTFTQLRAALQGSYNKGMPNASRFSLERSPASIQYGPNVAVIYRPGSVDDLALVWNLRARFAHPRGLPLAIPYDDDTTKCLNAWTRSGFGGAAHFFGLGPNLAVTSFSVSQEELDAVVQGTLFAVVDPWELQQPIAGRCVSTTEMAQFVDGRAKIPSFSTTDSQEMGQSFLGSHLGTWMRITAITTDEPLPPSPTMRRDRYGHALYLRGSITSPRGLSDFIHIQQPTGLQVLTALAQDRQLIARPSAPGIAGEQLIRAAAGRLSMFASPLVVRGLGDLTRRRHSSLVRKRLNQFLAADDLDQKTDRYQILAERLDRAVGEPDSEELGYLTFDEFSRSTGLPRQAAECWLKWAVARKIVLRGVEAYCPNCQYKQWRPLADTTAELICHGCGEPILHPHGTRAIDYRYRASEPLLRAMGADTVPAILALRAIALTLGSGSRDGTVFGGYPGVELVDPNTKLVIRELDVLIVLGNGAWVVGECKAAARGLAQTNLDNLWDIAEKVGASATFTATLDRAENCGDVWKVAVDPQRGRPHFGLTAEHLFELAPMGPIPQIEHDFFDWREDYVGFPFGNEGDGEASLHREFADYLLRAGTEIGHDRLAPWTTDD